ncbi:MAG: hypothetical protein AAB152_09630 [Candidatus Coatesbacteria bacterium]
MNFLLATAVVLAGATGPAVADYKYDILANPVAPFSSYSYIFPNWTKVPQSSFMIVECDDTSCSWCPSASMTGLTIFNYGTASGGPLGDVKALYWQMVCGSSNSGLITMTFAGIWTVGVDNFPAWTWAGSYAYTQDPCTACLCGPSLFLYTDISSCPTDGATVELGPSYSDLGEGGLTDNCWGTLPWGVTTDSTSKMIRYVIKEGNLDRAAPGDTLTYTVYYGRPGTTNITGIQVFDSMPPFTHYVFGSAAPPLDPGWDPDPGPPMHLRWSVPGGLPTGGPTGSVTFQLTVDWGNGESFEPGSGDTAAIENSRLNNVAQAVFINASCNPNMISEPTDTVVARFLFWKVGSNDILFASGYGVPDDEMTYEIFLKNVSTKKTWWAVSIWDTVPDQLDIWSQGYGLDDPCTGWTMTPSGCAAAAAGKVITGGGKTILTWKLDMAPGFTLSLRYRTKVISTIPAGSTCINRISLLEQGRTGIADGTGPSIKPANFTHLAMIVLRTMYFSYTSYAGNSDDKACPGFFISFFPLNMSTNFEFRKLEYNGTGVALTGGKSASINVLAGSCVGGFAADGGLSNAGCKIERTPAVYWPGIWDDGFGVCETYPFDFLYKVTSNSPILWLTMAEGSDSNDDSFTYLPSTSLNYCGFMHYTSMRPDQIALNTIGHGDRLAIVNTSITSMGVFDAAQDTTVHLFRWNPAMLGWDYVKTGNIAGESIWMPLEGTYAATIDDLFHFRIISSDTQMIIYQGYHTFGAPGIGGAFDNHGGMVPNRDNGNLVSPVNVGTFYPICAPTLSPNCIVGNTTVASPATYRIYKYQPISTKVPSNAWPTTMAGSRGIWLPKAVDRVNAGLAPGLPLFDGNAHVYGGGYDATMNSSTYATAWKIELFVGGPIQVNSGGQLYSQWAGASNLHSADGQQAGDDFWFHHATGGKNDDTLYINVFAPKTGMAVQINGATQGGGTMSARYTTDGVDQVIVVTALSVPAGGTRTNYRMTLAAAGAQGDLVVQYLQGKVTEKFFTAPFVRTGVHYVIMAPPTVFTGQSFWITIAVIDNGGGTKTDYCGTTSFTSTDATAKIESNPMDGWNYVWESSGPPSCGTSPWDNGVHLFINVSLTKLGNQTIVASDAFDGSIVGLTTVNVVGADVKLFKEPRFTIAASGDTVTFKVCWSNYSSASAFTFVVTDAIPMGTTFIPEATSAGLACGSTDGVAMNVSYSTLAQAAPPTAWTTANPVAGTRWLKWTMPMAGVQTTGCACFRVRIN